MNLNMDGKMNRDNKMVIKQSKVIKCKIMRLG
jgi:hypothetical protein